MVDLIDNRVEVTLTGQKATGEVVIKVLMVRNYCWFVRFVSHCTGLIYVSSAEALMLWLFILEAIKVI